MSGGGTNQRYTVDQVEKIDVADGKGEVLLMANDLGAKASVWFPRD
jgi:hypothetical protein